MYVTEIQSYNPSILFYTCFKQWIIIYTYVNIIYIFSRINRSNFRNFFLSLIRITIDFFIYSNVFKLINKLEKRNGILSIRSITITLLFSSSNLCLFYLFHYFVGGHDFNNYYPLMQNIIDYCIFIEFMI